MFKPFYPSSGRDNNFDLLRIFAASLVIFSHGWDLTAAGMEPIVALSFGAIYGGALGVWIFFFISGYLVSESFRNRGLLRFIEARFLRIYPAFLMSLMFGVLIGACVSTLSLREYITHEQTWRYVYRGLLTDIQFILPGVYEKLPFPNGINGSLWTIPIEMVMYVGVGIAGLLTILRRPTIALLIFVFLIVALISDPSRVLLIPRITQIYALPAVLCFALGVIFYTNRDRIPLHGLAVMALFCALVVSRLAYPPGNIFVCIFIAYTTAWFVFHPRLKIQIPQRIGDISYGLYVYAFPIQQTIIYAKRDIGQWALSALALPVTAVIAWISWRLVEKPVLVLKRRQIAAPRLRLTKTH